jgi:hypothetical protein
MFREDTCYDVVLYLIVSKSKLIDPVSLMKTIRSNDIRARIGNESES